LRWSARGSLEEMTGKAWLFVVVVVVILITLGPLVVRFTTSEVGGSANTVSSSFNFPIAGGSFVS
jgi:hypothetical protein